MTPLVEVNQAIISLVVLYTEYSLRRNNKQFVSYIHTVIPCTFILRTVGNYETPGGVLICLINFYASGFHRGGLDYSTGRR